MNIGFRELATIILLGSLNNSILCLQRNIYNLKEKREKAKEWLMKQRKNDWSWGVHTHRAIVALSLSDENFNPGFEGNRTIIKQLQIQLLKELRNLDTLPPYQIALYIQALLAICLDPRNFNGYNLIEELNKKIKKTETINPFIPFVLCNAKFKNDFANLDLYKKIVIKSQHPKWEDFKAWLIMTFICSIQNMIEDVNKNTSDIRSLATHVSKVGDLLNSIKEGSIQNIHSIAIISQILYSIEQIRRQLNITDNLDWDKENITNYLLDHQQKDGSFGDIITTYLVLPALYERSLLDLGFMNCKSANFTEKINIEEKPKITLNYSIWIGRKREFRLKMILKISPSLSFFDVMQLASQLDKNFRFKYSEYSGGIYVYSLAGIVNEPESDQSWQLYVLKDNKLKYIDESPENIIPKNEDNFVYWYSTSNHLLAEKLK